MHADCTAVPLSLHTLGHRRVEAEFDAGLVTSDTSRLLLREAAASTRMMERLAACFREGRKPDLADHSVLSVVDLLRT